MTTDPDSTLLLLPGWDVVRRDYIEPGLPGRVVVCDDPKVELFVDSGGARFGAVFGLPAGSTVGASPFIDIEIAEIRLDGQRCVKISTKAAVLFGTFYLFVVDTARAVIEHSMSPVVALDASLAHWRALLQTSTLLSDEKQLGLAGELWLLERLIRHFGSAGLNAWVGPGRQSHDFRLGSTEFEVKATTGARRLHMINGLHQLTSTIDANLYLVSLRFSDAGSGGETLGETVGRITSLVTPDDRQRLGEKLTAAGFHRANAIHYSRRRRLADRPRLIPVTGGVPRLTADALAALPASFASNGISDVTYRIDVEGLGFEEGTPEFSAVVPEA